MTLEARIGSTTYNLTVLRESFSQDERCGEAGKHVTSSYSVSVRPFDNSGANFGAEIFKTKGLVPCRILEGASIIFTGFIRPYVSTSANGTHSDNIEMEVMDNTEGMHVYVWPESETEQGRIKETVRQNSSLADNISYLFGLVGMACDTSRLGSHTMPWFRTTEGDYVDEVISRLLFEYGYDYRWTANGTATFFSTFKPEAASGTITDIRNTLTTSRSDDSSDGVIVTYKQYQEEDNVLIYNNDHKISYERFLGIFGTYGATLTGKYWKGTMHDSIFNKDGDASAEIQPTDWMFEYSGIEVNGKPLSKESVYFVDTDSSKVQVSLSDEIGVNYTPHVDSVTASGGRLWVDYHGRFNNKWTWHIKAYGTVGYAIDSEERFRVTGERPEKVDLRYRLINSMTESDPIKEFAEKYAERLEAAAITYSFDSLSEYTVGGYYILNNSVEGRSQVVRITSRSKDAAGIFSYEAEGASVIRELTVQTVYDQSGYTEPNLSAYQLAVINGYTGTEEDYIRQYANASEQEFIWSNSESDWAGTSRIFKFGRKNILVSGKPIGNFPAQDWMTTVTDAPGPGYFLWSRIRNGIPFRMTGPAGNNFVLKASSSIYDIDLRSNENNPPIYISWDISGYDGTPTVTCTTNASWYNASTRILTIPKNTSSKTVTVEATLDGVTKQTITISGVDKTEYNVYYGKSLTAPVGLPGDVYLNTSDELLYYKTTGGPWALLSGASATNGNSYVSEMCAKAQKDVLSTISPGSLTKSDFGYFNTIIAGTVTADYIGSKEIVVSDKIKSKDYGVAGKPGFNLGSDGVLHAKDAEISGSVSATSFKIGTTGMMFESDSFSSSGVRKGTISYMMFVGGNPVSVSRYKYRFYITEITNYDYVFIGATVQDVSLSGAVIVNKNKDTTIGTIQGNITDSIGGIEYNLQSKVENGKVNVYMDGLFSGNSSVVSYTLIGFKNS